MEILNNVLAVMLFTAVGIIRINKYNSSNSTVLAEQLINEHLGIDLSDFSTGEVLYNTTTTYPNVCVEVWRYLAVGVLAIITAIVFQLELLWSICKLPSRDSIE